MVYFIFTHIIKFTSNRVDRPIKSLRKMTLQISSHEANVLSSLELDLRTEYRLLFQNENKNQPLDNNFTKLQNEYVKNNNAYQVASEHQKTLERRLQQWERYENGDGPKPHIYAYEATEQNNFDLDTVLSLNDDNKSLLSGIGSNIGSLKVEREDTKVPPIIEFKDKNKEDSPDDMIDHSIGMVIDIATTEVQEKHNKVPSDGKPKSKNNEDSPDENIDHSTGMVNDTTRVKEGINNVLLPTKEVQEKGSKVPSDGKPKSKNNEDSPDDNIDHSIGMVADTTGVKEGINNELLPTKEIQEKGNKVPSDGKSKSKNNEDSPDDKIDHSTGMVTDTVAVKAGHKSASQRTEHTETRAIEIHNGVYMYQDVEIHFRFSNPTGLTKSQKRRRKRNDARLSLEHQDNLLRMGVISKKYVGQIVKVIDESADKEYSGSIHCVGSSSGYTYSVIDSNAHRVVSSSMPAWRIALIGTDVDLIMNSNRLLDVISRTSDNLYKIPIGRDRRRDGNLEE